MGSRHQHPPTLDHRGHLQDQREALTRDFGGQTAPFHIYVGEPCEDLHPLHYQREWLSRERGGTLPTAVVDSFAKLHDIAKQNKVSFEELCVYALGTSSKPKPAEPAESAGDGSTNATHPGE
jgi:hypothetical protein